MTTAKLSLGVMARSLKENERRLALHPRQLDRIPADLRGSVYLEHGYGERFGLSDDQLADSVAGLKSADELVHDCDVILQPKPVHSDITGLRDGQIFWGWPHCVQDRELTQTAIDKRLTMLAFEAMNHWTADGAYDLHVFHQNNELAGYASVLHALTLAGSTGAYGRRLNAAVVGFGATARGAVNALTAFGVTDVDVLTQREVSAVKAPMSSMRIVHFDGSDTVSPRSQADTEDGPVPLGEFLVRHDIIVNCVLQNPDAPAIFLAEDDLPLVRPGSVIVDVSCDAGMGFSWAQPTSFDDPTFVVGDNVLYYAVDHSPSLLWESATWVISEALLPFLGTVLAGPEAWDDEPSIKRAIEIRDGVIQNPAILSFQRREAEYPHRTTAE